MRTIGCAVLIWVFSTDVVTASTVFDNRITEFIKVTSTASLLGALFVAFVLRVSFFWFAKQQKETIGERVEKLTNSLRENIRILSEIEAEVNKRKNLIEKLSRDQLQYEQLTNLRGDDLEAISQVIMNEARRDNRASLLWSFVFGLFFFIAGAVVSWLASYYYS